MSYNLNAPTSNAKTYDWREEPDGFYALPPGYRVPNVTRWDTPWFLKQNLSVIPPPPGVQPNFIDPPSQVIYNHVTLGVCLPVATLLVAMRTYTKIFLLKNFGWEDWCSVGGWVGLVINSIVLLLEDAHGAGKHMWDITGDTFMAWLKIAWVTEIIYNPIIFSIKLSILLLYLRVFKPIRWTYIILHLMIWINLGSYTSGMFVEMFQCNPVAKIWMPKYPGHCINQKLLQYMSASFNIVSDAALLILPIWSVWGLQTDRKKKVGLICIFAFGALGCIASAFRLVVINRTIWAFDLSWNLYSLNLWTTAEMTCGLICSCLPMLPAFIRHMPRIRVSISINPQSKSGKSSQYYDSSGVPISKISNRSKECGIILASPASDPSNRSQPSRKDTWDDMDDLDYVGGDELKSSSRHGPIRSPGSFPHDLERGTYKPDGVTSVTVRDVKF